RRRDGLDRAGRPPRRRRSPHLRRAGEARPPARGRPPPGARAPPARPGRRRRPRRARPGAPRLLRPRPRPQPERRPKVAAPVGRPLLLRPARLALRRLAARGDPGRRRGAPHRRHHPQLPAHADPVAGHAGLGDRRADLRLAVQPQRPAHPAVSGRQEARRGLDRVWMPHRPPPSTYRFQLGGGVRLADAIAAVPYLDALGVGALYLSPVAAARPGSGHGYDVIDPTRINPELGDEDDLRALAAALAARGMGLLLDI